MRRQARDSNYSDLWDRVAKYVNTKDLESYEDLENRIGETFSGDPFLVNVLTGGRTVHGGSYKVKRSDGRGMTIAELGYHREWKDRKIRMPLFKSRTAKGKSYEHTYRIWRRDETKFLLKKRKEGWSTGSIALALERPKASVRRKSSRLPD